jgi:hypothetical protein
MMKQAFVAALLSAKGALAADYCDLNSDQIGGLPIRLTGYWSATMRDGMAVTGDGQIQPLPAEAGPAEAHFTSDGSNLTIAKDTTFPGATFLPYKTDTHVEPDFALPGEVALRAAALLASQVKAAGLPCDPMVLPQFVAKMANDTGASATLRVFAFGDRLMVMVVTGAGDGKSARAVFDLTR